MSTSLPEQPCLCNPCGETTPQGAAAWCSTDCERAELGTEATPVLHQTDILDISVLIQAPTPVSAGQQLERQGESKPSLARQITWCGHPGSGWRGSSFLGQRDLTATKFNPFLWCLQFLVFIFFRSYTALV